MGATLNSVVDVNISLAAAPVSVKGFGMPLILGGSNRFTGGVLSKIYTSLAGMLSDGFETSDPEYLAASAAFAQPNGLQQLMVGYATQDVAEVQTITPTVTASYTYSVTINGVTSTFTYSSGGASAIVTGLAAAINAQSPALPVVTSGSTTLILTSSNAGEPFTVVVGANLSVVDTTPEVGMDTALSAITAAGATSWYQLILCSRTLTDIETAAAWIEANGGTGIYTFLACSQDSGVLTNSGGNVLAYLAGNGYLRTTYLWSDNQSAYPDAAWSGLMLPTQPGSQNWAWKTLSGVTPTALAVLTASAVANLTTNYGNYYCTLGGVNVTQPGIQVGNQWLDVIWGRDWLAVNIQAAVFQVLVSTPKVGFTDAGINLLANAINGVLLQGVAFGIIQAGFTLNIPQASSFTSAQKGTRILPSITWSAELVGAINGLTINGSLVP